MVNDFRFFPSLFKSLSYLSLSNFIIALFSWSKVLGYITGVDDIQTYYGKLRDKERNSLKEKFSVSSR